MGPEDEPSSNLARWVGVLIASFVTTAVVFGLGYFFFFWLIVFTNGFSSSQAEPVFFGYWLLVNAANALGISIASILLMRGALESWLTRVLVALALHVCWSLLPNIGWIAFLAD